MGKAFTSKCKFWHLTQMQRQLTNLVDIIWPSDIDDIDLFLQERLIKWQYIKSRWQWKHPKQ